MYTLTTWLFFLRENAAPPDSKTFQVKKGQEPLEIAKEIIPTRGKIVGKLTNLDSRIIAYCYLVIQTSNENRTGKNTSSWCFLAKNDEEAKKVHSLQRNGCIKTLWGPNGLITRTYPSTVL